jgi:hypothetical protein
MTSALLASWAEDGLKELLGRKRPTELGPSGPGERSPPDLPGFLVTAPSKALGSQSGPMGRVTLKAHRPFILSLTEERGFAPPFGARRAWQRRHRRTHRRRRDGAGSGHGAGVRSSPSTPPLDTQRTNARLEGRPTAHLPQRAARR